MKPSLARNFLYLLSILVTAFTVGCASVPMESEQTDAKLKKFEAPKNLTGLYIYRNETLGAAIEMQVALDGAPLGRTGAKTYLYKEIGPGKHRVTSTAENVSEIEVDAVPGTLSFIFQEVKMGVMSARTALSVVAAEIGKAGVLESKAALTLGQVNGGGSQSREAILPQVADNAGTLSGFDPVDLADSGSMGGLDPAVTVSSGSLGGVDPGPTALEIGNDDAIPFISDRGREDYRTWLQWYSPKAFAISENGKWYGAHGNLSSDPTVPTDPSQRALQFCEKRAKMPCKLYAVDRSVVFGQEMAAAPK